jgi:hypothetical protein
MSGHFPSASLFDLAGLPLATALDVPLQLAAANLLRSSDDLCLIDPDGQSFTLYGYFTHDPAPLRGTDGAVLSTETVLGKTTTLSAETFQPFRPFAPDTLEALLTVAFGEHAALHWQDETTAATDRALALAKTALAGVVTCNGVVLRRGDTITLGDLRNGRVRYYHDETETAEDSLEFTSTDANDPLVFRVRLAINVMAA